MDFILKRINEEMEIRGEGAQDYMTYLRCRIEYILFFLLGVLWDKNQANLSTDDKKDVISHLKQPTIGSVLNIIKTLNDGQTLPKNALKAFDDYRDIRNHRIGHGYASTASVAPDLKKLYNKLMQVPFIKREFALITVEQVEGDMLRGVRFDCARGKTSWTVKSSVLPVSDSLPCAYVYCAENGSYHKISPFVTMLEYGNYFYVFNDLTDNLSGEVTLCPLFGDAMISRVFPSMRQMVVDENYRIISPINSTIMNKFDKNYQEYHEVGLTKLVRKYICGEMSQSAVAVTIWGHGGVGKTACIQNICDQLFHEESESHFAYIVFVTAKNQVFDSWKGEITPCSPSVNRYDEVISEIVRTIFRREDDLTGNPAKLRDAEEAIQQFDRKALIIIDDFETFEEAEKQKIREFIPHLNAAHHKVVITTRNKQIGTGQIVPIDELDAPYVKQYALAVIQEKDKDNKPIYPAPFHASLNRYLSDEKKLRLITESTSGRPVFINQFVHLFVQAGDQGEQFWKKLSDSESAKDFLYGRIYESLSPNAKDVFGVLSQISDNNNMFRMDTLEFLLEGHLSPEQVSQAFDELADLRVLERTGESTGRFYAAELLNQAKTAYEKMNEGFHSVVQSQLSRLGTGRNKLNLSVPEALLQEADLRRNNINPEDAISRYRNILNQKKFPQSIRKTALLHAAQLQENTMGNSSEAVNLFEAYLSDFSGDPEVCMGYEELLWRLKDDTGGNPCRGKAVEFIRKHFGKADANKHGKHSPENELFFAVSVARCTNYDLQYRPFPSDDARFRQYSNTINEYGKELFEVYKERDLSKLKNKPSLRHSVQMALTETMKMCLALGKSRPEKLSFGRRVYEYGVRNFKEPFLSQIHSLVPNEWKKSVTAIPQNQCISCVFLEIGEERCLVQIGDGTLSLCFPRKGYLDKSYEGRKANLRVKQYEEDKQYLVMEMDE